jgi:hypothetical protein
VPWSVTEGGEDGDGGWSSSNVGAAWWAALKPMGLIFLTGAIGAFLSLSVDAKNEICNVQMHLLGSFVVHIYMVTFSKETGGLNKSKNSLRTRIAAILE